MRGISEIILHCSASNVVSYDFEAIKYDHTRNRGWTDIGYHFGIDFDGDIHILRPVNRSGAHVKGRNRNSIGVCVLGLDGFTHTQMLQLGKLCDTLCAVLGLKTKDVRAHYEFNEAKTCPNFDVEWFKETYMKVSAWR